jgi:hypothetical protein
MYAASFDCKKASTFIENTICNDTELSKLDDELAKAYKKVWNSMSDKTELKKEQFDWLKNSRDKCMSLECLKTSYTNRVLYLTNYDSKVHSQHADERSRHAPRITFCIHRGDEYRQHKDKHCYALNAAHNGLCKHHHGIGGEQSQQHYGGIPHKRLFFHAHSPSQIIYSVSRIIP